jgi:predicted membrane channel-forming protein YqfA (hemolysin III family)
VAAQCRSARRDARRETVAFMEEVMNGIIYLVGLIVIIMAILSFLGLR